MAMTKIRMMAMPIPIAIAFRCQFSSRMPTTIAEQASRPIGMARFWGLVSPYGYATVGWIPCLQANFQGIGQFWPRPLICRARLAGENNCLRANSLGIGTANFLMGTGIWIAEQGILVRAGLRWIGLHRVWLRRAPERVEHRALGRLA